MTDTADTLAQRTAARMLAYAEKLASGASNLGAVRSGNGGCTENKEVLRRGPTRLLAYSPRHRDPHKPPLLVVYALVNRPYMLDLEPERSFLRGLLEGGRCVYLVDWGYPGTRERGRTLEDYVVSDLDACTEAVMERHPGQPDLLGVCQGGSMSLCHALARPGRFRKLVLIVTPVDYHDPHFLLARWLRHVDVEAAVQRLGNIPGGMLNQAFLALKPLSLSSLKARDFIELMDDPAGLARFARMERWIQDSPDQAGRAFAQFVQVFFRDNALVNGGLTLDGKPVRVCELSCPLLNVYAREDHIVPPSSSRALSRLIAPGQYTERGFDGGHIGLFASRRSAGEVPLTINQWLDGVAARSR